MDRDKLGKQLRRERSVNHSAVNYFIITKKICFVENAQGHQ